MQIAQTTHERLSEMLDALKLTAIRDQLDRLLGEAARQELTLADALAMLCERELGRRHERRIEMGLSIAKFPAVRELSAFDYKAQLAPIMASPAGGTSTVERRAAMLEARSDHLQTRSAHRDGLLRIARRTARHPYACPIPAETQPPLQPRAKDA